MSHLRSRSTALLVLLVVATVVVTASTYRSISHTWDEPAHLANGFLLLDSGTYIEYQHPPLARLAIALGPYLGGAQLEPPARFPETFGRRVVQSFDEGRRILYGAGEYDRVLTLARLGILPFLALLLAATYVWARGLLGDGAALMAALFLASTSIVLGNAGIATLDIPLTALAVTSLLVFCRWLERPTTRNAIALGAVTGAAVMTKFSAIPFLGICFVAIALWYLRASLANDHRLLVPARQYLKTAAAAAAAGLLVGWLSYGGGFVSPVDPANRPYEFVDRLVPAGTANGLVSDLLELPVVPYFLWAMKEGVQDLSYHNRIGHTSFLLGQTGEDGWWNYYLVGWAIRTPLPLLVAGLGGLTMLLWVSWRKGDWRFGAPAIALVAVLVFVSAYSRINLGIRHILIVYPLLAIGAAYAVTRLAASPRRRLAGVTAAAALLVSHLSSAVLAHPDHLAYFNAVVGSTPERFLIMADLDWGQDMKRLEAELRARDIDRVAISFNGSNDLSKHDLPAYSLLQPNTPESGWIAISIWRLYRNEDFRWLRAFQPVARIGRSVNLYYIPDSAAVRAAAAATP